MQVHFLPKSGSGSEVKIKLLDEGIVPAWLDLHYLQVFAGALAWLGACWCQHGHTAHGFIGALSKSIESVGRSFPSQFILAENLQVEFHLAT